MKKRLVHIIISPSPHTASMARTVLSERYSEFDNKCIVYGSDSEEFNSDYSSLLERKNDFFRCKSISSLFSVIRRLKCKNVVCHGDAYIIRIIPLLMGCNVIWVCWGAYTRLSGSLLSYLTYPIKFIINHSLRKVVVLELSDKKDFQKTYKLNNVVVLPYPSFGGEMLISLGLLDEPQHTPLRVLIGNNGHCSPWYSGVIRTLAKFKNKTEVHCMFQYPSMPDKELELEELGRSLLNDSFVLDKDYMSPDDFFKYLSSYDIYICPKPTQSGLGVVHKALFFGKKVYLTGNNLAWERYLGAIVYSIDDIANEGFDEFAQDLTIEEKETNRKIMLNNWNRLEEWLDLYRSL